jgi:hypothetical protein
LKLTIICIYSLILSVDPLGSESIMAKKGVKKPIPISAGSQYVIDKTLSDFDPGTVELGNKILMVFSRSDVSDALNGEEHAIEAMRYTAWKKGWTSKDNAELIQETLRWIKLVRTVSHRWNT